MDISILTYVRVHKMYQTSPCVCNVWFIMSSILCFVLNISHFFVCHFEISQFSVSDFVIRPFSSLFSPQDATYEEVGTNRAVHHDTNFIVMEKNVAYDSVDFKA